MSPDPPQDPEPYLGLQEGITLLDRIFASGEMSAQKYNDLVRELIYTERDEYSYDGSYEPKSVVDDDPFDAMSHQDIFEKVSRFKPDAAAESSNNWRAIGNNAVEGAKAFADALQAVNDDSWQGPAATAAVGGVRKYARSTSELSTSANLIANKLLEAHTGLHQTKADVPPPLPVGVGEKAIDMVPDIFQSALPGVLKGAQHAREEAEEAARQVMRTVYMPVVHQADDQVPVLPTALDPIATGGKGGENKFGGPGSPSAYGPAYATAGSGGSGWTDGGSGSTGSGGSSGSGGGTSSSGAQPNGPATAQGTATQASNFSPSNGQHTGTNASNPLTSSNPSGTQGAFGSPGNPHGNAGTSSGGPVLGSPVGGGSRGAGAGSGASGSASRFGAGNGLGTSRLGAPGFGGSAGGGSAGGGSAGGGAGGSAASAGRPGAPGMGGMAPAAGRGGNGGEDDVHKTPGYLVDAVNGDELIGVLPLVVPPVLGG